MSGIQIGGTEVNQDISAKAETPDQQCGVVVVSFDDTGAKPIQAGLAKCVIRKRVPKTTAAEWLYVYVNSPVCAIVARAAISKVDSVSLRAALNLSKDLCLSPDAITQYFEGADSVGIYRLKHIEIASKPPTLEWLRDQMIFHPPQSFLFLSVTAKKIIDSAASFKKTKK